MGEVQEELQELGKRFEYVEHELKAKEAELAKALTSIKDAKAEAERSQQEIQEAKKIAAGKKFFMQSKHVEEAFLLLTRVRSSPGAFADLPIACPMPPHSIEPRRAARQRRCSSLSMLRPDTPCR